MGRLARVSDIDRGGLIHSLTKYIKPVRTNVKVWGTSLIELKPIMDENIIKKAKIIYGRKFRKYEIVLNGKETIPNGMQLTTLRPQLTGIDLLITSPTRTGKTLTYLLPEFIRQHYRNNLNCISNSKMLILVPTLDLIVQSGRMATSILKKVANVEVLYYRHLLTGDLSFIEDANVIFTTPNTALKAILKFPNIFSSLTTLVIDEAQRLFLNDQTSLLIIRLKNLLPKPHQTVVLSSRNEVKIRQFISRLLRVDFRIISFSPEFSEHVEIAQHIPGPHRSSIIHKDNHINENEGTSELNHCSSHNLLSTSPSKVQSTSLRLADSSPPEVSPAVSSSNYLSLKSMATPGDRGDYEGQDVTSSGKPVADLREAEGEVNREADGRNVTSSGEFDGRAYYELMAGKGYDVDLNLLESTVEYYRGLVLDHCRNREVYVDKNVRCDYILYRPIDFVNTLGYILTQHKKIIVIFPTVRMTQFCYIYFKHLLKFHHIHHQYVKQKYGYTYSPLAVPPEVSPAVSSSNYLSLKSRATPGDRGDKPAADLREAEGEVNRKAVCKTTSGGASIFYSLHGHLSLEKREYVMNLFDNCNCGILFSTDVVSVGLNFNGVDCIVQIGASTSVDILADRIGLYNNCYNVLLLHDLDTHILHISSQYNININQRIINKNNINNDYGVHMGHELLGLRSYRASLELMYRSLLGYYCNISRELMFERWQVPSLINEIIKSFGYTDEFSVSKQFAARLQILNSPGLNINYNSIQKTELYATATIKINHETNTFD